MLSLALEEDLSADATLVQVPVYLDHVFYPTMTQAGFVTEVHNVNGKGEDSGVVYSEMQGRENGSGDLMQLRCVCELTQVRQSGLTVRMLLSGSSALSMASRMRSALKRED